MRTFLLIIVGAIFGMGLVMIFSTTSAEVLDHALNKSTHEALLRQLLYAFIGGLFVIAIDRFGYRDLLRLSPLLLVIFTLLLLLTLVPGVGKEVNGSRRWIHFAGLSFQPSEFVKYLIPVYFINRIIDLRHTEMIFRDFLRLLIPIGAPLFLILIEPNNGTAGVIIVTLIMLFLLTRIPFKYWGVPLGIFIIVGGAFASQLPYVSARLNVYFHPELDIRGKGHQPHQAKIAAGSGRLFGKGPGNSWQKLSYLPEAQNDYIAAIYAEEFGFLGVLSLITLYMLLALAGFYIANEAKGLEEFYLAVVVTFLISFQAFLNLGVVSGLLPSTGLNLPFFSQGGSSLIANLMGVGLLFNLKNAAESVPYS